MAQSARMAAFVAQQEAKAKAPMRKTPMRKVKKAAPKKKAATKKKAAPKKKAATKKK